MVYPLPESAIGNGAWTPLTDDYGFILTNTSDGNGGIILSCPKYGSQTVTATQLLNKETQQLVARVTDGTDFPTNWQNLVSHLAGNG